MNSRVLLLLVIAVIFAAIAALIANVWINQQVQKNSNVKAQQVIVAKGEIPFGTKLENIHIKAINWPKGNVPEGAYNTLEDVVGKIAKNKFYPGEIITEKRIADYLGGSALSSLVSENSRAVSIRVDDVVGVSGFVLPGNRVDILATQIRSGGGGPKAKTRTILENIKVLAVDQEASTDTEKPAVVRAVTLELTPEQAEKIVSAMQEGKIQLALRNPLDSNYVVRVEPEVAPVPKKPKIVRKKSVELVPW